jgi:hypothetical protein
LKIVGGTVCPPSVLRKTLMPPKKAAAATAGWPGMPRATGALTFPYQTIVSYNCLNCNWTFRHSGAARRAEPGIRRLWREILKMRDGASQFAAAPRPV